jgi:prophage regulatory protein
MHQDEMSRPPADIITRQRLTAWQTGATSMSDRYLRRGEVELSTGLSRSTIYRRIQERTFPRPFNLGGSCVRWREQDLVQWKQSHSPTIPTAAND